MSNITPVNGHLLIEPIKHESFIATPNQTYEEKGTIIALDPTARNGLKPGDIVYFDAWLGAKYPGEKDGEFLWFVKFEDVRAVEYGK